MNLSAIDIQFDECTVGYWRIIDSCIATTILELNNAIISNCLDLSQNIICLKAHENLSDSGIIIKNLNIGNNTIIHDTTITGDAVPSLNLEESTIGGALEMQFRFTDNLHVNLNYAKVSDFNCVAEESMIDLELDGFETRHFRINGTLPDSFVLKNMLSSIPHAPKCSISVMSGEINILRKCQEQLELDQDSDKEANEIWRLRNDVKNLKQNAMNKNISYWRNHVWDRVTDYGLSSSRLFITVFIVFVLYSALNYISLSKNPIDDGSLIGQSLIQYIPTIDFGTELKIIDFESSLPSWYKYLVIAGRITGFILISILVASFAGVWRGRKK